ncbi:MAG: GAF domain-containing protein [Candidatus Sulfotelmatobacter sp.]
MAVMISPLQPVSANRRRRVRHRIQTPAYATFTAESQSAMLDLHEIVDISEDGVAIQYHSPLALEKRVNLCLDLADCDEHIFTTSHVVWSNSSGRAGLRFSELPAESVSRLRQWLFVNVMAGVANGEADLSALDGDGSSLDASRPDVAPRPNYTDTLAAVSAVQRQVEALGRDLAAVLPLVAERALTLVRASGAAIALADADPDFMVCRASSGPDAPPIGARLQVGSGFSGECVKTGMLLRCDDAELDPRVDRESCRALGIRSILAAPVRVGEKSIGILEVFCALPNAFSDTDSGVLQSLAQTVLAAINRAARAEHLPPLGAPPATKFTPPPGSVLFASAPDEEKKMRSAQEQEEDKHASGISLPLSHLIILVVAAAMIFGVLGYTLAPWIQAKLQQRGHNRIQTVLASSKPPAPENSPAASSTPAVETASFEQLRQMAENTDPAAENALGLRYFQGDEKNGIARNETEAFRWFSRAADHGNLAAQAKLGALYWGGRGVPKDVQQAYFWTVLARARGDEENKDLAAILASGMTHSQASSIEQQADSWLQQHMATWKPAAGH